MNKVSKLDMQVIGIYVLKFFLVICVIDMSKREMIVP